MSDKTVYHFFSSCVAWPYERVDALHEIIDNAIDITRNTFLKHVDREGLKEIEESLGYESHPAKGLTMAGDYHVSYARSSINGYRVYFFKHSAIEYVFITSEMAKDIDSALIIEDEDEV